MTLWGSRGVMYMNMPNIMVYLKCLMSIIFLPLQKQKNKICLHFFQLFMPRCNRLAKHRRELTYPSPLLKVDQSTLKEILKECNQPNCRALCCRGSHKIGQRDGRAVIINAPINMAATEEDNHLFLREQCSFMTGRGRQPTLKI